MKTIYLDHNSTTPISLSVAEVMAQCYRAGYVNPASQHRLGQQARTKLEQLRQEILTMLGGSSRGMSTDRLIFTSGGTESNNLAIAGFAELYRSKYPNNPSPRIIVSSIEHPSVLEFARSMTRHQYRFETIDVDHHGVISIAHFEQILASHEKDPIALIAVMAANNETGALQPVGQLADQCRQAGIFFHCDAVQIVGKRPLSFSELNPDSLAFTAHKFHGPRGIGGLLLRHGIDLPPMLFGGFQQMAIRPGTEDVALVAGMHQALREFGEDEAREHRMTELRDYLENGLKVINPFTVVNSAGAPRMGHTSNVSFPNIDRQAFLMAADIAGLAISTGSACASGSSDPSHVIVAMGAPKEVVDGSIRFSLAATTTRQEIDDCLTRFRQIYDRLSTVE